MDDNNSDSDRGKPITMVSLSKSWDKYIPTVSAANKKHLQTKEPVPTKHLVETCG